MYQFWNFETVSKCEYILNLWRVLKIWNIYGIGNILSKIRVSFLFCEQNSKTEIFFQILNDFWKKNTNIFKIFKQFLRTSNTFWNCEFFEPPNKKLKHKHFMKLPNNLPEWTREAPYRSTLEDTSPHPPLPTSGSAHFFFFFSSSLRHTHPHIANGPTI